MDQAARGQIYRHPRAAPTRRDSDSDAYHRREESERAQRQPGNMADGCGSGTPQRLALVDGDALSGNAPTTARFMP